MALPIDMFSDLAEAFIYGTIYGLWVGLLLGVEIRRWIDRREAKR